jgi:23S rRNA (guanosine2251-2'-O)-methyltransferase
MADPSRKQPKKKRLFSGNHQRSWLWGYHAVTETLLTSSWPVLEIFANRQAYEQSAELLDAKRQSGIPLQIVPSARLEELARSTDHQGLVIRLGQFPYRSMDTFTGIVEESFAAYAGDHSARAEGSARAEDSTQTDARAACPLVVICDSIQDSFNFGAILRSCDGVGVLGVVVGQRGQAEVTPHVVRSSSGAVSHVPIVRVDDLIDATGRMQRVGFRVVAADANTNTGVWGADLSGPTALVIGSEAKGISPELLAICDEKLCIPMRGKVTSLNAAVAAGILLYEIRRQQVFKRGNA